jgi:CelD/BcsL family acetyltransferase involved in cellulose biosynthesis
MVTGLSVKTIGMREFYAEQKLDKAFWSGYENLWHQSGEKSPFQAPALLYYFSRLPGCQPLALVMRDHQGFLAAVLFRKTEKVYGFLSDLKSDTNGFVFHSRCKDEDKMYFIDSIVKLVKQQKWMLILNKVPGWAGYAEGIQHSCRKSGLFRESVNYSVCPVAEAHSPEELFRMFNRSRQFRYAANRIRKSEHGVFEVFHDDTNLDSWVSEFCETHIKRWAGTPTPSAYQHKSRRDFLRECLQAWSKDHVLLRFSVSVEGKRIGFSINLIQDHTLIGHSTTYDPDFRKLSPGKSLIYYMGEWMLDHDIREFDFGYGDEEYKYALANKDKVLKRFFISHRRNIIFIIKAKAISNIRRNERIYKFYRHQVKVRFNQLRHGKIKTGHSEE